MKISRHMANFAFKNGTNLFAEGTTLSDVEKALEGFDDTMKGLSDSEKNRVFEETGFLKSYMTEKVTDGVRTREKNLRAELEPKIAELTKQNESLNAANTQLKSSVPMPDDPAELRKRALDEPDPNKRMLLNLQADNIELKTKSVEREKLEQQQAAELAREKLVNLARTELQGVVMPSFIDANLHHFVGSDEETTKGKIQNIKTEIENYKKDIVTAGLGKETPPGPSEEPASEEEAEAAMVAKMNELGF